MIGRRILLVEGLDDKCVFYSIFNERQICGRDDVDIKVEENKQTLLKNLPVHLKGSNIEALGVVLDADADLENSWLSIYDRLIRAGYEGVPTEPFPSGTVISAPENSLLPRVGIWLMPNNQTTGILEDFLRLLVPQPNMLFTHAERSIDSIPQELRLFSEVAKPKVLIHTWLAWQRKPGKPLGLSITARFLDPTLPAADDLVSWLKRVFFPDNP
ncbi:MAG TPA: DUF3226 domain-containing protein [Burkholderiales bacterium]|jgi:hypothetical protein|nr:DUF3226 domain-containing protein [Burkholderiales bacterium]